MKKRIVAVGLLSSMLMLSVAAQAKTVEVKSDGCVDIAGKDAAQNSIVTMEVISDNYDLSDESVWSNFTDDGSATAFMGTVQSDENGEYEFNVFLKNSGRYNVRVGNSGFDSIKEDKLWFVNKDKMATTLAELKNAAKTDDVSVIKNILQNKRFDIGLFAAVGDEADYDKAASALAEYVKANQDEVTEETVGGIAEKACVLSVLGDSDFDGFDKYADGFGLKDLEVAEYYDDSFAAEFTKLMKKSDPKTVEAYNTAVKENVVLCMIKLGDSSSDLKECLEVCAKDIGLSKSDITEDMCKSLMENTDITSFDDVKDFAEDFTPADESGSGSHGGGGGGGGGSYVGKPSDNTPDMGDKKYSGDLVPQGYQGDGKIFTDMEGYDWAVESVEGLFAKGVLSGRESGKFVPEDSVLREEFVKMVVKSFELSVVGDKLPFEDVEADGWYKQFVECAYTSGIVSGYSDKVFGIGDAVSREDIAVMILRAVEVCDYKFKNTSNADITFGDESEISDYAKDAVAKLASAGIINGDENGNFNPKHSATRAETAKILWMTLQNCVK